LGRQRRHGFRDYWHQRSLVLDDGDVLRWTLIDDPLHLRPHAECFRTDRRGNVHVSVALELLRAVGHADVEHVHLSTAGHGPFH
jgi:hypothetical protein